MLLLEVVIVYLLQFLMLRFQLLELAERNRREAGVVDIDLEVT